METKDFEAGEVILIDKGLEWTSFDVVKKIRNAIKIKKIGHAGTLDPLASGLLILCTGKFTKKIDSIQADEKEYTGKIYLGYTTPSYDLETAPEKQGDITHLTEEIINAATSSFTGPIEQLPPIYSAIHVNGTRMYELARKGKADEVERKPRPVQIHAFEITEINLPLVSFRVVCSKGTYIRSLAHDFGAHLGCGAYLAELRRTRSGSYNVNDAITVDEFVNRYKKNPTNHDTK